MITPSGILANQPITIFSTVKIEGCFGRSITFSTAQERAERNNFLITQGIDPEKIAWLAPKQGAQVFTITDTYPSLIAADAVVTKNKTIYLGLLTADCFPVIVYDPTQKVIGLIHVGWRGVVLSIVEKTLQKMQTQFLSNTADVMVFIGPGIGAECYRQKGWRALLKYWLFIISGNRKSVIRENEFFSFDLKNAVHAQLKKNNISATAIEDSGYCTVCSVEILSSNFREGKKRTTSILTVAGIKQ